MKKLLVILALALLAGCTSRTEFGQCVGIAEDKDPSLIYKLSIWNMVLGLVFAELIVPPVIVVAEKLYCPTGKK